MVAPVQRCALADVVNKQVSVAGGPGAGVNSTLLGLHAVQVGNGPLDPGNANPTRTSLAAPE
eukprot:CAMPEP_0174316630 /NCGR_PEP_ID=MMETSP0810-20121108/7068_1 /TAXON_ID=73025 ORGANISM="Eutreptiella gymnastica-like, Strain CCMP1594" /NCGR_SAMPLE_ID=MMETSP0810 /ASSEMBLY_ACC=CAM_ASM_000659 /LENGTH=61 /DNA_ID=CAMNT_0015426387 /DNA_START=234 /DNA_END=420 /DNA_ORIENTATION=-